MKILITIVLVFALTTFLTACGGGGGGGDSIAPPVAVTNSVFKGSYEGAWATSDQHGLTTINISTTGQITGNLINQSTRNSASIQSGSVDNTGRLVFTYKYYESTGSVAATATIIGNNVKLIGTNYVGGQVLSLTSNLINTDAVVDVTNASNTIWDFRDTDTSVRGFYDGTMTLFQNGNIITGIYTTTNNPPNGKFNVYGSIHGSAIKFTVGEYGNVIESFDGIVSTGSSYEDILIGSSGSVSSGTCMVSYTNDPFYSPTLSKKQIRLVNK